MKKLTLQITRNNFDAILQGTQKIETRYIYPNTAKRYFVDPDAEELTLREYDVLYLINGRRKDSPRLTVEVKDVEWHIMVDEETGEDVVYVEDGTEYLGAMVIYHLGKVLSTENIQL